MLPGSTKNFNCNLMVKIIYRREKLHSSGYICTILLFVEGPQQQKDRNG